MKKNVTESRAPDIEALKARLEELQRTERDLTASIHVARTSGFLYACAPVMDKRREIITAMKNEITLLQKYIAEASGGVEPVFCAKPA